MANNFNYHTTETQAIYAASIVPDMEYKERQDQVVKAPAIGLEIEKQCLNFAAERPQELARATFDHNREVWRKTHDGSLDDDAGYELVSPILPLSRTRAQWLKALEKVAPFINEDDSTGKSWKCGGHIHLSIPGKTPYQIYNQLLGGLPILYAVYINRLTQRRPDSVISAMLEDVREGNLFNIPYSTSTYSRAKKIKLKGRKNLQHFASDNALGVDRYDAINCDTGTKRTLEFRIFGHVQSVSSLIWRIQLLELIVTHCSYKSEHAVLKMIIDPGHAINRHLRQVYTPKGICGLVRLFVQTAKDLHFYPFPANSHKREEQLKAYMAAETNDSRPTNRTGRYYLNPDFRCAHERGTTSEPQTNGTI
jgi:hypothetical protein